MRYNDFPNDQSLISSDNAIIRPTHFNASEKSKDDCAYEPTNYLLEKFALVTVFGTCVCVVGFVHNCILVHILARSPMVKTHVFYLAILAVCDILTEISYIMLMSIQVLYDYTENLQLYIAWNKYLKIVFTLTHVSLTIATYTIVSASAERYLSSTKLMRNTVCTQRRRWLVTFGICVFALLSKGLVYWEVDVIYRGHCAGFGIYVVRPSTMASDPPYKVGYMLWFRHIVHVFFPFVLLLCLNGAILSRLKRSPLENVRSALVESSMGEITKERKKNIRAATMMLGAIATTYLISNVLNVVITVWEHVDLQFLLNQPKFYTFAADTISLLTVFTGAIRFPIYCACNGQLRRELRRLCKSWYHSIRLVFLITRTSRFGHKESKESGEAACIHGDSQQSITLTTRVNY